MYLTREVQKRASDLLVLELQAVLTCLTWVLGPELNSQSSKGSSLLSRFYSPLHCVFFELKGSWSEIRKPKQREKRDPYILAMGW